MRRRPGFWIALVLFLGLAAWIRYFESRRPAAEDSKTKNPFMAVEPARVAAITAGWIDTTRMEKQNGVWQIVSPVAFPADPYAIEALLSRCRDLPVRRAFDPKPGTGNRYGLESPRAWVQLDLTDSSSVRLLIGAPAAASPTFYVQVAGRPDVGLLSETDVDNYFRKDVNGWRRRNLFVFKAADARSVDLEAAGQHVSLASDSSGTGWRVVHPFPGPVDGEVMKDFLKGVLAMKTRSYPADRPASLEPFGLRRPRGIIAFGLREGRRDSLLLGDVFDTPAGTERYARTSEFPNIFGVPPAYLGVAARSDFFFRAQRPFGVALSSLSSVLIRAAGDSLILSPDSSGVWRLQGENAMPGSPPPDRTDLVRTWASARADSIVPAESFHLPPAGKRLIVEVRTAFGRSALEVGRPITLDGREIWPSRLIFSDPPRPSEVFLLNSEVVRQTLALFEIR